MSQAADSDFDPSDGGGMDFAREAALNMAVQYAVGAKSQTVSAAGIIRVADIFLNWLNGGDDAGS